MPSVEDICNSAISLVGGSLITNIDGADRNAKLCNVHFPEARKFVLAEREWTFATKDALLDTAHATTPVSWGYGFALPVDHLRTTKVSKDGDFTQGHTLNFDVIADDDGPILVTDAEQAYIKYIWNQKNINTYSPQFVLALSHKLASLLCNTIAASRTLKADLDRDYLVSLNAAASADGRQRLTQRTRSRTFVDARSGYFR